MRVCRRSNERAQIALIAIWLAFATLFTIVLANTYRHPMACLISVTCSAVAWFAVVRGISGFCWPYNIVFEITTTELRFGREDQPEKMTVFRREMLRGVRIDFDDREILVDVGSEWLRPCLSGGFLTTEQLHEVKRFITEHWPKTPII